MSETIYSCSKCGQTYEKSGDCCGQKRDAEQVRSTPPGTIPAKYDDGKGNPKKD